jgi:hypothetical protein
MKPENRKKIITIIQTIGTANKKIQRDLERIYLIIIKDVETKEVKK